MQKTVTDDQQSLAKAAAGEVLTLTVVHHPDAALVGARRALPKGSSVVLGREGNALPGAFDERRVSRKHVGFDSDGKTLAIRDLDSHNGTFVNGERVSRARANPGDVLAIGGVAALLHMTPRRFKEPRDPLLIGIGAGMAEALRQIELVGDEGLTVAVVGETGTGKELVAQAIHERSGRKGQLVPLNCAGVGDTLLQSELFGHRRGAFTGAQSSRRGLVEAARGGTLFLDEIADASPSFQASLLRLLETGTYRPVGSDETLEADVRFVAATQPGIFDAVERGDFRTDLWMRLSRWVIRMPALRDRPEDVPTLARHFVGQACGDPDALPLTVELVAAMARHPWPGNVRALQSFIQRAVVTARSEGAEVLDLTPELVKELEAARTALVARGSGAPAGAESKADASAPPAGHRRFTERPEADELEAVLRKHHGSVRAAAKDYDVDRKTIYRWVKALDIDLEATRSG